MRPRRRGQAHGSAVTELGPVTEPGLGAALLADSVRRAMARPRARAGDSRSRLRRRRRRAGSPSPGATGSGNATDGRAGARPSPLSGRRPGASPPYFRAVTALGRNAVPVAGRRPLYGILSHLLPLALARLLLAGALSHWPASAGAAPMDRAIAPPAPPTGASGPTPCGSFWQPIGGPLGVVPTPHAGAPTPAPHAGVGSPAAATRRTLRSVPKSMSKLVTSPPAGWSWRRAPGGRARSGRLPAAETA